MVDAASTRAVAILTRAPSAGGKTRVFRELGIPPDPALLAALLLDTLDGAATADTARLIFVTPDSACDEVRRLAGRGVIVVPQGDGDLGARMRCALEWMFSAGFQAGVLTGSDLPHLSSAPIEAAWLRLAEDPGSTVLGPSGDGGYYLLGATTVPPIFEGPVWGGKDVLTETIELINKSGLRAHLLEPLDDVDSVATLRAAVATGRARRTAEWWRQHQLSA